MKARAGGPLDPLSIPYLFGAQYFIMFGLAALDAIFDLGGSSFRLRTVFVDYHGVSLVALAHVWFGFVLFLVGYFLPVGSLLAQLVNLPLRWVGRRAASLTQGRATTYTAIFFAVSFPLMVSVIRRFGTGRFAGREEFDPAFSSSYIAGEVLFIVYAFGIWRLMLLWHDGEAGRAKLYATLVGVMFAVEIASSIIFRSRWTFMLTIIVATLAWHYGYRRIRFRSLIGAIMLIALLVIPVATWQRDTYGVQAIGSLRAAVSWVWDSLITHYSALEGYTVTYENLATAPPPDPLSQVFISGLIPRLIWPNKPFSDWGGRFSVWATGADGAFFFPSLPGEMLLHFGRVGALVAMMMLGIVWRTLFVYFARLQKYGLGFIYIVLVAEAIPQFEVGFVVPYGGLLRSTMIGLMIFLVASRSRRVASAPLRARAAPSLQHS